MTTYVPFDTIGRADLHIDTTYGSRDSTLAGEPLQAMFRCGNQGGFRQKRSATGGISLVVLFSTLDNPDWPDHLDEQEGVFVYYGDNKKPGDLHVTKRAGKKTCFRDLRSTTGFRRRPQSHTALLHLHARSARP